MGFTNISTQLDGVLRCIHGHLLVGRLQTLPLVCQTLPSPLQTSHRFTRMVFSLRSFNFKDWLQKLGLWLLEERQNRANLIEVFKIAHGFSAIPLLDMIQTDTSRRTPGHSWKFVTCRCNKDTKKFFSHRVVSKSNMFDNDNVMAKIINSYKIGRTCKKDGTVFAVVSAEPGGHYKIGAAILQVSCKWKREKMTHFCCSMWLFAHFEVDNSMFLKPFWLQLTGKIYQDVQLSGFNPLCRHRWITELVA